MAYTPIQEIIFSKSGALSAVAGTGQYLVRRNIKILGIRAAVGAAPTGASLIADVNKNGTTIYSTQANRPTISAGSQSSSAAGSPQTPTAGVSLGTNTVSGASTTVTLNTASTVPSNSFLVLEVGWFHSSATLSSVSGGSLTWNIDKQLHGGVNDNLAIVSAQAPSGLASGTTITATFSASVDGRSMGGYSFTNVASSSALDVVAPGSTANPASTWDSTSVSTTNANDLLIGVGTIDGTSTTMTPGTGYTELLDWNNAADQTYEIIYRNVTSTGSYNASGTAASGTGRQIGLMAAYKAAVSGSGNLETVPDITTASSGDLITVDIDQVGSSVAGSDLTLFIRYIPI